MVYFDGSCKGVEVFGGERSYPVAAVVTTEVGIGFVKQDESEMCRVDLITGVDGADGDVWVPGGLFFLAWLFT